MRLHRPLRLVEHPCATHTAGHKRRSDLVTTKFCAGETREPESCPAHLAIGNSFGLFASNSHFGVVAQPSRLRVRTASRRSKQHGAGRPMNSQARTPALRQKENCCVFPALLTLLDCFTRSSSQSCCSQDETQSTSIGLPRRAGRWSGFQSQSQVDPSPVRRAS